MGHKRIWGIWLALVCMAGLSMAQSNKVDSLKGLLRTDLKDDHRCEILINLGNLLSHSDYNQALAYYEDADSISKLKHLDKFEAKIEISKAELYQYLGADAIAMASAIKAFDAFMAQRDTLNLARTCLSMGLMHSDLHQYEQARVFFVQAGTLYEMAGNKRGVFAARHNLAVMKVEMGDTVASDSIYRENLRALSGTKYNDVLAATYNNLALNMNKRTETDSAFAYYQMALIYKRRAGRTGPLANTFINLAELLRIKGDFKGAQSYLDSAAFYLPAVNSADLRINHLREMGELEMAQNNWKIAAQSFQKMSILLDSLYQKENVESAQRMSAAFQTKDKENQISLLRRDAEIEQAGRATLYWFVITLGALLILVIATLFFVVKRSQERKRLFAILNVKNKEIERQKEEILEQVQKLEEQNQLLLDLNREKDGLVSIVAHDLRSPLNRSEALAELISASGPLTENQLKFLNMIRRVNQEGGQLIQDILELNALDQSIQQAVLTPTDLGQTVKDILPGFERQAKAKDIQLTSKLPETKVEVLSNGSLLTRVLDNLISNAIKFTHPGKGVEISVVENGQRVYVSVKDQGPGISEEDQAKMFGKFQRLSARPTAGEPSTGLGLSIVKTLLTRLDSSIEVQSKIGEGAEFKVILPKK